MTTQKLKPGRKPTYESPAARTAAYRERKKLAEQAEKAAQLAEIESLRAIAATPSPSALPDPKILDLELKVLQIQSELFAAHDRSYELTKKLFDAESKITTLKAKRPAAPRDKGPQQATRVERIAALKEIFVGRYFAKPDDAKRVRVNTNKAANATSDIVRMLKQTELKTQATVAGDIDILRSAAAILSDYGDVFETVQSVAERAKAQKAKEQEAEHKKKIEAIKVQFFGNEPDPAAVTKMAQDLIEFAKISAAWLIEHKHVESAYFHLENSYALEQSLKWNPTTEKITNAIAECAEQTSAKGRRWIDDDGQSRYSGGWADFVEWREGNVCRSLS